MNTLATYFAFSDIPGHLSYLIIAISYCLANIFWLRVAAILGLGLEILYFMLTSNLLYTGICWDMVFIAINSFHLGLLIRDRLSLKLAAEERRLMRAAFVGLHDAQIARILKVATWRDFPAGSVVTEEGRQVRELYFIQNGKLAVHVKGAQIAELGRGALIGEIAFLMGNAATATVIAQEEARLICFDHANLLVVCRRDDQIAAAMHRLIGRDLAAKITHSDSWWGRMAL